MPEQTTASTPEHIHESFDTNIRPIVAIGVILFVFTGITMLALYIALIWMKNRSAATDAPPNPVARGELLPPEPRLQPSPPHQTLDSQDLVQMHAEENARLKGYGRDANGNVHIPIARAMELMLQQQQSKQPGGAQ